MWISNVAGALPIVEFAASQLLSTGSPAPTITVTSNSLSNPWGLAFNPQSRPSPSSPSGPAPAGWLRRQPRDPYPTDRAVSSYSSQSPQSGWHRWWHPSVRPPGRASSVILISTRSMTMLRWRLIISRPSAGLLVALTGALAIGCSSSSTTSPGTSGRTRATAGNLGCERHRPAHSRRVHRGAAHERHIGPDHHNRRRLDGSDIGVAFDASGDLWVASNGAVVEPRPAN